MRLLAHADPLTGLANRRLFRDSLASRLADPDADDVAVFFIDLDHFKQVNDSRGHADGDALIIEVAQRLSDLVHGLPNALVARLGGDEFAVMVTGIASQEADALAGRMVASLGAPYMVATHLPVSASVGIAAAAPLTHDAGVILRWADLAMYAAKSAGRGCWRRHQEAAPVSS